MTIKYSKHILLQFQHNFSLHFLHSNTQLQRNQSETLKCQSPGDPEEAMIWIVFSASKAVVIDPLR